MRIEPEIVAFEKSLPPGAPATKDPARRRAQALVYDTTVFAQLPLRAPAVATADLVVQVPGFPAVPVRIYYPTADAAPTEHPVPAFLMFFGGGFTQGGIDFPSYDAGFRRRAADSGVAVVAVDYALAPEVRYPAPVEQGYAVLSWLMTMGATFGLDSSRAGIGGMSAGGNIAAAVTLMNLDRSRHPLRLQILEVPSTDLTLGSIDNAAARGMFHIPGVLARGFLRPLVSGYLGSAHRRLAREPYASPLRAKSHAGLPPAHILTAEFDPLRGDGERYAEALWRSGVPATSVRYAGQTHGSSGLVGISPGANRWHRDVVASLRLLHGGDA